MNTSKVIKEYESTKQGVIDNKVFLHMRMEPTVDKAYKAKFLRAMKNAINLEEFIANRNFSNANYIENNMHCGIAIDNDFPFIELMVKHPLQIAQYK